MKKLILMMILATIFLTGCGKSLNYWGIYSYTLYKYKKNQTDESFDKHKRTVEKIIRKSEKRDKKVPPGIYCEYGYYMLMEGDTARCLEYFDKEMNTYPESETFIKTLKTQFELEKENPNE